MNLKLKFIFADFKECTRGFGTVIHIHFPGKSSTVSKPNDVLDLLNLNSMASGCFVGVYSTNI